MWVTAQHAHTISAFADFIVGLLDHVIRLVQANEPALSALFKETNKFLDAPTTTFAALALFFIAAGPRALQIADLWKHYKKKHPLPAYRRGRVRNEHIEIVRTAIRTYLNFLIFLVAASMLKMLWSSPYLDALDFLIQLAFFGHLLGKIRTVQSALQCANENDAIKQEYMHNWLNKQLDGLKLTTPQLARNVGWVTFAFTPILSGAKLLSVPLILGILEAAKAVFT